MNDNGGQAKAASGDGFVQIGGNVPLHRDVVPPMSDMNERHLASTADCVAQLKRVLHCLDEILPAHAPSRADDFALAGAYVQQVIDLLD